MLKQERLPYLFVALVGLLTWSLNNIIENTKLSPIVEYRFDSGPDNTTRIWLSNLSSSSKLTNLTFNICLNSPSPSDVEVILNPSITAIPPSYLLQSKIDPNRVSGKCFDFIIYELQPNSKFVVTYNTLKEGARMLRLKHAGDHTVRIIERNFLTFALRNQLFINGLIFLCSILTLCFYYFFLAKKTASP